MKNRKLIVYLFGITLMVVSCSQSKEEKLRGNWWYSDATGDMIKFEDDKNLLYINEKDKSPYEIIGDSLKITSRDYLKEITDNSFDENGFSSETVEKSYKTAVWIISTLNDSELVIKNADKIGYFKIAKQPDFLVGKWKGIKNGEKIRLNFRINNELILKEKDEKKEFKYTIKGNKIIFDSGEYEYTLSKDKNHLELKGNVEFILDRK
ncbi:MAG: hypothetical protein IPG89_21390 [Bacteroidetes bacterium]|nr:hypothetical protein [Bacteroidota bacterium]